MWTTGDKVCTAVVGAVVTFPSLTGISNIYYYFWGPKKDTSDETETNSTESGEKDGSQDGQDDEEDSENEDERKPGTEDNQELTAELTKLRKENERLRCELEKQNAPAPSDKLVELQQENKKLRAEKEKHATDLLKLRAENEKLRVENVDLTKKTDFSAEMEKLRQENENLRNTIPCTCKDKAVGKHADTEENDIIALKKKNNKLEYKNAKLKEEI